jgi:NitT/TauT family transport system ATP-binding protein
MAGGEITVSGLVKTYGAGHFARPVVEDCSFTIERNRFTVMIGPSGVGKSTIIRMLAGFEKPDKGKVLLDGVPVSGPGRDRLVVFQESALFPWMTTIQNVLYGPRASGESRRVAQNRAGFLIDRVGLDAFQNKYPSQLSGGMQRRAELARAMVNNPA